MGHCRDSLVRLKHVLRDCDKIAAHGKDVQAMVGAWREEQGVEEEDEDVLAAYKRPRN